jgi:hypothetical protein
MTGEQCLFNLGQDGYYVPCLLSLGHAGNHDHEPYCNSLQCMCGAMRKRLSKKDTERLWELSEKIRILKVEKFELLRKYQRGQ